MSTRSLVARTVVSCAAATIVLVGCGGTGGEAGKSAQAITTDASHAATAATSVHVKGAVSEQGQSVPIDLRVGPDGAVGTVSFAGTAVALIRSGDSIYVRGAAQVLGSFLGPQAAARIANHWVQIPTSLPQLSQFAGTTDKKQLVDQLLTSGKSPSKAGTKTVAGQKVVALNGFGSDGTATLLVAATGTPYPVQLVSAAGTLSFSEWNAPVAVTKPADVVSLASLTG